MWGRALCLYLLVGMGCSLDCPVQPVAPPTPPSPPPFVREYVTVTGYCTGKPCTRYNHGITRSGDTARNGICAADWSVYPQGTEFIVPGYGYCIVRDTGNRVQGKVVDLWFSSAREARQWGRRVLTIWRING